MTRRILQERNNAFIRITGFHLDLGKANLDVHR